MRCVSPMRAAAARVSNGLTGAPLLLILSSSGETRSSVMGRFLRSGNVWAGCASAIELRSLE